MTYKTITYYTASERPDYGEQPSKRITQVKIREVYDYLAKNKDLHVTGLSSDSWSQLQLFLVQDGVLIFKHQPQDGNGELRLYHKTKKGLEKIAQQVGLSKR